MTDTSLLIVLAKLQHLFAMPTDVERFVIVHELCLELLDRAEAAEAERDALQAENGILRFVLQSIADNTCCDGCREAALVARVALLKVKP
jgi:hypothetical protein